MNFSAEPTSQSGLNIGHVLFMDVVGYSKLLNTEQQRLQLELTEIVRKSEQFQAAEAAGKLIRLPTGDGMALVFFNSPDAPVRCAVEISRAIKNLPQLSLRMGIHSGPVSEVADVNDRSNAAGAGINIAQRVMDCGDAGHILLSKRVADDLRQDGRWQPQMHELGECAVKHGVEVSVVNLFTDEVGNPEVPARIRLSRRKRAATALRRRILIPAAAILIGVMAGAFILKKTVSDKSVAVLPLENLSDEKENAYFADGIQEELLSNLAKIKDLKVISRTSVMQYKTRVTRNLKEIAQQLGVSDVVEGSVRRSGDHIRVSVELIDALTDRQIWTHTYDRTLADSLALQGELATKIAAGVGATLSPQEKARLEATPTGNIAAYDAYLQARAFSASPQSDRSNNEGAIRSYQEAVKLDSTFALAWTHLSVAQSLHYWQGFDPSPVSLAAAKDAVDRAVMLNPDLPEVHLALGYYRYYGLRDFTGALVEFQQAEQGLPNSVDVLAAIGLIQRRVGHWNEAIAAMRRAVELDPRNTGAAMDLTTTYAAVRRYPEAFASVDRVLAFDPTNRSAVGMKVFLLWETGDLQAAEPLLANPGIAPMVPGIQAMLQRRYPAAVEIFSKALAEARGEEKRDLSFMLGLSQQRAGNVAAARATFQKAIQDLQRELETVKAGSAFEVGVRQNLGLAYAGLGNAGSAIAEGQKAMALNPTSKDPFEGPAGEVTMAQIYALLGDRDHAIPLLKRLLRIPAGGITPAELRLDGVWDQIRDDPRFQELLSDKT